ncbi:MAG: ATP-dependent DNA helicase [Candidatus Heimdallarchaeaceae archaeon]
MTSSPTLVISVRSLVEYALRSGDIYIGFFKISRSIEGIKGHIKVQKSRGVGYNKEVQISHQIKRRGCVVTLRGRIDGVWHKENEVLIEEIKTTTQPLENITEFSHPEFWAQAKCYAYLYAKKNNLTEIKVQLLYFQVDTQQQKSFTRVFSLQDLKSFVNSLVDTYLDWALTLNKEMRKRNESLMHFQFPFDSYRKGQEKLIKIVEQTIQEGKTLFCQAPTGIGKTIATLYPAILSIRGDSNAKVFYLTAKTTQRSIAEKTFEIMRKKGLKIKTVTITARAKTCFKEKDLCDPYYCEYAKGHFNRINEVIKDIFSQDAFTQKVIEKYSKKHHVCPFELSLELAQYSDCIICDYNYLFDPRVKIRRFFEENNGDYIFLIDEAHNLVDRAREMFSAELSKKVILKLTKATKAKVPELYKVLHNLNDYMIKARKLCEQRADEYYVQRNLPEKEFLSNLRRFSFLAEEWLVLNEELDFREELMDFYFGVRNFLRVTEEYDESYVTYFSKKKRGEVLIKLFCLDPRNFLKKELSKGRAAIFFSATLTPLDYFVNLLCGPENSIKVQLSSPFPEENLCLLLNDYISTKYRDRQYSYSSIAKLFDVLVKRKIGNYLIYFPSYEYMYNVLEEYKQIAKDVRIIQQEPGMTEEERKKFLENFSAHGKETLVGFAVLGGIFGESIDLIGERLSGAIIVGVGLPKLCLERELIRQYFDAKLKQGFHYAYTFPGMNKVLQAAGRVIRTKTDTGVVLLIDRRFSTETYKQLFPPHWTSIRRANDINSLSKILDVFWNE